MPRTKNRSPYSLSHIGIQTPDQLIANILSKHNYRTKKSESVRFEDVKLRPLLGFEAGVRRSHKILFQNGQGCRSRVTKKKIAKGSYGSAHLTCCDKRCGFVTKYIKLRRTYTKYNFYREIMYAQLAANAGLAPRILECYLTRTHGVIVMEQLTGLRLEDIHKRNLEIDDSKLMRKRARAIAREIGELLTRLHALGIFHGDAHDNNIIQDAKGNWKLIDFGMATEFGDNVEDDLANIQEDYNTTLLYRNNRVPSFDSHEWSYIRQYYKQLHSYLKKDMQAYNKRPYTINYES